MSNKRASKTEADLRFAMVEGRYGDRLDADQLQAVRKTVETIVEAAQALRSVRLDHSDEPFPLFKAHRGDD